MPDIPVEGAKPSGFISDQRILDNYKATSSLQPEPAAPNAPEPQPAEPAPLPSPQEPPAPSDESTLEPAPIAEPAPEPDENDFSAELPDLPSVTPAEEPDIPVDSPLTADAPKWQHEAYRNLKSDPDLSDDDKREIAKQPPGTWTRARAWSKSSKILGKYRDKNVPISEVHNILERQDKDRTQELTSFSVSKLIDSPELSAGFAKQHPEVFSRLIVSLVSQNPQFLTGVIERQGYKVVKGEPFDADKAIADLEGDPMWEVAKESSLGEAIIAKFKSLGENQAQPKELDASELASELKGEPTPDQKEQQAFVESVQQTWQNTREKVWLPAVADGLRQAGIKPATEAEIQKAPAVALLKNFIYNIALRGMPGVLPDWDEQSYAFGETKDGFKDIAQELQGAIQKKELDRFSETAPALNEFYYEFGQRRASIGVIKNTYAFVNRLLESDVKPPEPLAPTTPESINGSQPVPSEAKDFRYGSDRLVLEKAGLLSKS